MTKPKKIYAVNAWNRSGNETPRRYKFNTYAEAKAFADKHKAKGWEVGKIEPVLDVATF